MSFTFNWAGVQGVRPIEPKDRSQVVRTDAANLGTAVAGFDRLRANREYADMLGGYDEADPRIQQIERQIAELEAQNAQLLKRRAQLAG